MKPFIFQFKEHPSVENTDNNLVSYSPSLNLNIDNETGKPAISTLNLSTETFTKTQGEVADTDRDSIRQLMATETVTLVNHEGSDSDRDRNALLMLLGTSTGTKEYDEQPDSDHQ